jgi:hypothetical protein
MLRTWDKIRSDYVEVPIQYPPDTSLSCAGCRYYDFETRKCTGVGSSHYRREIPYPEYVPRNRECIVRLPPELFSFVEIRT